MSVTDDATQLRCVALTRNGWPCVRWSSLWHDAPPGTVEYVWVLRENGNPREIGLCAQHRKVLYRQGWIRTETYGVCSDDRSLHG
jgi:hypothetical protein